MFALWLSRTRAAVPATEPAIHRNGAGAAQIFHLGASTPNNPPSQVRSVPTSQLNMITLTERDMLNHARTATQDPECGNHYQPWTKDIRQQQDHH